MNTVEIPLSEYQRLQEELELLKNTELLRNFNKLVDLLNQEKYGLFMNDYTEDLTEAVVSQAWQNERAIGIMYKQREIVLVPFPYSDLS